MARKTKQIMVLFTEEQHLAVAKEANRRGMGISTLARYLLLEAAEQNKRAPVQDTISEECSRG